MMDQLKELFLGLQPRERVVVVAAAAVLLVLLVYLMAWEPLNRRVGSLRQSLESQSETLSWMRAAAVEVRALKSGARAGAGTANQSLLTVIDQSARAGGIKPALQRMEPEGSKAVRLWLGATSFDGLVAWLGQLERQHGIQVTAMSLEPKEIPGIVEARVTLERGT